MSWLIWLGAAAARSLGLALAAGGVLAVARPRRPQVEMRVWTLVLLAGLAMPWLPAVAPRWRVVLPAETRVAPPARLAAAVTLVGAGPSARPQAASVLPLAPPRQRGWEWLGVYLLIAAGLLAWLGGGMWGARRLRREARAVEGFAGVYESGAVRAPVTVGAWRTAILLPLEWREWSGERLAAALAHERAHISHHDVLWLRLALLHRAVYWFSPLGWWLPRRLAALAEEASDEAVLATGMEAAGYAEWLVGLARVCQRGGRMRWQALAMASGRGMERRVEKILDWKKEDAMKPSTIWTAGAVAGLLALTVAAAAFQPARAVQPRAAGAAAADGFQFALVAGPKGAVPEGAAACQYASYDGWTYVAFGDGCTQAGGVFENAAFAVTVAGDTVVFYEGGHARRFTGGGAAQAGALFAALDANNAKQMYLQQLRGQVAVLLNGRESQARTQAMARQAEDGNMRYQIALAQQAANWATGAAREAAYKRVAILQSQAAGHAPADATLSDSISELRQRDADLGRQLDGLRLDASGQVRQLERGLRQLETTLQTGRQ